MRERRVRRRAMPAASLAFVLAGVALIAGSALALDGPGRRLLYWHTTERLLIGDLASLLIAVGLRGAVRGRRPHRASLRLRALMHPGVALPLWAAVFLLTQLPAPYDAALRHSWLRLILSALLIGASVNMWSALLAWRGGRRADVGRIAYALAGRLIGAGVACVAIWSPDVYYPYYLHSDIASSTSPLADQGIAGAIMLGEMALTAIALLGWLRWELGRAAPASAHAPASAGAELPAAQPAAGALAVDVQQA